MKKKIALGAALAGAGLLALSLVAFGLGAAAATQGPDRSSEAGSAQATQPAVMPAVTPAVVPVVLPADVPADNIALAPAGTPGAAPADTTPGGAPTVAPTFAPAADWPDATASAAFVAMAPDKQAHAREWIQTQTITAACMKDKGFAYNFEPYWATDIAFPAPWTNALSASERAAADVALYGDTGAGADYHWDDAGCWGYAVHTMGNDNAH